MYKIHERTHLRIIPSELEVAPPCVQIGWMDGWMDGWIYKAWNMLFSYVCRYGIEQNLIYFVYFMAFTQYQT